MTTITVYIENSNLINFRLVKQYSLTSLNEEGHKQVFSAYPFKLYSQKSYSFFVAMNIPLDDYILFLGYGLIDN